MKLHAHTNPSPGLYYRFFRRQSRLTAVIKMSFLKKAKKKTGEAAEAAKRTGEKGVHEAKKVGEKGVEETKKVAKKIKDKID